MPLPSVFSEIHTLRTSVCLGVIKERATLKAPDWGIVDRFSQSPQKGEAEEERVAQFQGRVALDNSLNLCSPGHPVRPTPCATCSHVQLQSKCAHFR